MPDITAHQARCLHRAGICSVGDLSRCEAGNVAKALAAGLPKVRCAFAGQSSGNWQGPVANSLANRSCSLASPAWTWHVGSFSWPCTKAEAQSPIPLSGLRTIAGQCTCRAWLLAIGVYQSCGQALKPGSKAEREASYGPAGGRSSNQFVQRRAAALCAGEPAAALAVCRSRMLGACCSRIG